ncbi:MAG: hypothetical protein BMS9Abin12_1714 [Acidimicrobiia bacterium]|nr:MAG: hypothetical protein BMS9Abin12_1714 [Acidimicrobiia bacterium]
MGASHIVDIGRRVELVANDPLFHGISIGLYAQDLQDGTRFVVHTYNRRDGARDRIAFVSATLGTIGEMDRVAVDTVRFSCDSEHLPASCRMFLEATRLEFGDDVRPRSLSIFDKKTDRTITVVPSGFGAYEVTANGPQEGRGQRTATVARGLAKLAGIEYDSLAATAVVFSCGQTHDAVIGALLVRALNVRTAMREIEQQSARGSLSAPSAPAV